MHTRKYIQTEISEILKIRNHRYTSNTETTKSSEIPRIRERAKYKDEWWARPFAKLSKPGLAPRQATANSPGETKYAHRESNRNWRAKIGVGAKRLRGVEKGPDFWLMVVVVVVA